MSLFARELPPTAGLPMQASDFLPGGGDLRDDPGQPARHTAAAADLFRHACAADRAAYAAQARAHRDTVILPAYTCPLVPIAVHSLGLRVQLCDTRRGHFDFDPASSSGWPTRARWRSCPPTSAGASPMSNGPARSHAAPAPG
jgi:hypothetical protein